MKRFIIFIMVLFLTIGLFARGQKEETTDVVTIMVWDADIKGDRPVIKYLEEKLNIKIEWRIFPHEDRDSAISLMIAGGGELPDIFPSFFGTASKDVAEKDIIVTISDLMAEGKMPLTVIKLNDPNFQTVKNQITNNETGKIYALPNMFNSEMFVTTEYIRSDWLEKLGIEDPKTVWEYRDMLRAIKYGDPNGNGIADEVPWQTGWKGVTWFKQFSRMFGLPFLDYSLSTLDGLHWSIVDDEVVFVPTHERFKAQLEYIGGMWLEGLFDAEQFVMVGQRTRSLLFGNILGARQYLPISAQGYTEKLQEIDPNAFWHAIPYPIDPRFMTVADTKYARRGPVSHTWSIAKNNPSTEAAIRLMDYIFGSEEFVLISEYGIEGIHHSIDANGNPYYIGKWADMDTVERALSLGSGLAYLPHEYRDIATMLILDSDPKYDDYNAYMAEIEPYLKQATLWKMSADDNEVTGEALKKIQTYVDESITKFVIGTKPFSEWDAYVQTVNKEAGIEIEAARQIYQDYFDKYIKEFY